MINLLERTDHLQLIDIKHPVPQVGSNVINYSDLKELNSNKIYDFVVDSKGFLKIGKGHYKLNDRKNELYFAGRLKLNDDHKIYYIDNDSGHYVPTKQQMAKFVNSIRKLPFVNSNVRVKHINVEL